MCDRTKTCKSCNKDMNIVEFVDCFKEKIYSHCHACRVNFIETLPTKLCIVCRQHQDKKKFNYFGHDHKICEDCQIECNKRLKKLINC